jgi:hypothetical protein
MARSRASDSLVDGTAPARAAAAKAQRAARRGPCSTRGCGKKVAIEGACFCVAHGRAYVATIRGGTK